MAVSAETSGKTGKLHAKQLIALFYLLILLEILEMYDHVLSNFRVFIMISQDLIFHFMICFLL